MTRRLILFGACLAVATPLPALAAEPSQLEAATEMLDSGDPEEIEGGIQMLGLEGSKAAVAPLVERVRRGLPLAQLESAVLTLGALGQAEAAPVLVELLRHRRPEIRHAAAEALGGLGEVLQPKQPKQAKQPTAAEAKKARREQKRKERRERRRKARKAKRAEATNGAEPAAKADPPAESEPAAPETPAAPAPKPLPAPPSPEEALRRALEDADPKVRAAAATALGQVGTEKSLPQLLFALDRGNMAAAGAIGHLVPEGSTGALLDHIGRLPVPALAPALTAILTRPELSEKTQLTAIGRLQELGTSEVKAFLQATVAEHGDALRRPVKQAISQAVAGIK